MKYLVTFGRFWYDFIVGDDWRVAVGVIATLTLVYVAAQQGITAWWALPLLVTASLGASVNRAAKLASKPNRSD